MCEYRSTVNQYCNVSDICRGNAATPITSHISTLTNIQLVVVYMCACCLFYFPSNERVYAAIRPVTVVVADVVNGSHFAWAKSDWIGIGHMSIAIRFHLELRKQNEYIHINIV